MVSWYIPCRWCEEQPSIVEKVMTNPMRWITILCCLSLLCLSAQEVSAKKKRTPIAIITLPGEGADLSIARDVRVRLLKAFKQEDQVKLFDPLKTIKAQGSAEAPSYLSLTEEGKQALQERQYRKALQTLTSAVQEIRPALSQAPKAALSEALLYLAAAQLGVGKHALALKTLKGLLVWRQQHPLMLQVTEPRGWSALTTEARHWLTGAPTGSVEINSTPQHAEVFIDGRRRGTTPVVVTGLFQGTHYLTLQLEGHLRLVVPIEVKEEESTVSIRLDKDLEAENFLAAVNKLKPMLGKATLSDQEGVAAAVGAPLTLFIIVAATRSALELKACLYDLQKNQLLAQSVLDTGRPVKSAQLAHLNLWNQILTSDQEENRTSAHGRAWYKKWWVWAIAGTSVAALSIALPLTLGDKSSAGTERLQLQW
jgi:hypothetical protein